MYSRKFFSLTQVLHVPTVKKVLKTKLLLCDKNTILRTCFLKITDRLICTTKPGNCLNIGCPANFISASLPILKKSRVKPAYNIGENLVGILTFL